MSDVCRQTQLAVLGIVKMYFKNRQSVRLTVLCVVERVHFGAADKSYAVSCILIQQKKFHTGLMRLLYRQRCWKKSGVNR